MKTKLGKETLRASDLISVYAKQQCATKETRDKVHAKPQRAVSLSSEEQRL